MGGKACFTSQVQLHLTNRKARGLFEFLLLKVVFVIPVFTSVWSI
jgi:hypothetical protein